MTVIIQKYTQLSTWDQLTIRAKYSPLHFYVSGACHDWKTGYPYILLKATNLKNCGEKTKKATEKSRGAFMIDSLGMWADRPQIEQVRLQIALQTKYGADILIVNDKYRDPQETTILTLLYLKELIKQKEYSKEIMVIIQGKQVKDYLTHFDELFMITTNAQQCINCQKNGNCPVIFQQTASAKKRKVHEQRYVPIKRKQKSWMFRFSIGGLVTIKGARRRSVKEQARIIDMLMDYATKTLATVDPDVLPKRKRRIFYGIRGQSDLEIRERVTPGIQFHILGVGASEGIFPTLMKHQPLILSFDSRIPSQIALVPKFFTKTLRQFPVRKKTLAQIPYNELTFRQKVDDVTDVSALNMLRTMYNLAMLLYAMESQLKLVKENRTRNLLKRYIKYPSPKQSRIKQTELEQFFPVSIQATQLPSLRLRTKVFPARDEIAAALTRWTRKYESTGEMPHPLALLNGLIIHKTLTAKQVAFWFPTIKSPTAAMNVITEGYAITRLPICEDTPEYIAGATQKAIRIQAKYLDLVLRYLLKDETLIDAYKREYYK